MSNTTTGINTMSKTASASTSAPAVKKVSKKSDAEAPVAVAVVAAVAAPAPVKKAKAAPAAAATAAAPAVVEAAPVATAVAETAAAEVKTIEQEIAGLIATHQKVRDESIAAIKTLQRFQKRVAKDLKEAGRRRRRVKKEDDGTVKEKRPTIFTTPVTIKDELCVFLNKPKGTQMTPADVTRAFSAYVETHKLKDAEKGHTIHPDAAMRKVLGVKDGENLSYRNVQSYLYKLYVLPEKKTKAL
jgi:chromatin remodeling complex protein RSC6